MMDVLNLQRKVKLDLDTYRSFVESLSCRVSEAQKRPFTVAFIADARMKQLNSLFRDKDSTTDVLSFPREIDPLEPQNTALGDVVISAEQAERQASENKLSLEAEIKQLILHGLLHLCGYDHETDKGEMNDRELQLRSEMSL